MIGKIFTRFEKGRITSSAQMCLRVDFILIEVPLAHRRVKVVVFVHHCIFPSFLFLKSVILVTCTVSGGNIEPGGPNEVMYKSILRVYTLVPMRCCLCILLYISSKVVPMRWCVRVRVCTLVLMRWCRYAGTTNAPRAFYWTDTSRLGFICTRSSQISAAVIRN